MIRLGLIGEGIGRSRMPELQHLAAERAGLELRYEPIDLEGGGAGAFERTLDACAELGFRGVNVTHPFKERVVSLVRIDDARVRAMGAVNTVILEGTAQAEGFNTDYSGALRNFRRCLSARAVGAVAIVGAGGAGRALAFALAELGAAELRLFDLDRAKAVAVQGALRAAWPGIAVEIAPDIGAAAHGAEGLINCTPLGMAERPGMALRRGLHPGSDRISANRPAEGPGDVLRLRPLPRPRPRRLRDFHRHQPRRSRRRRRGGGAAIGIGVRCR